MEAMPPCHRQPIGRSAWPSLRRENILTEGEGRGEASNRRYSRVVPRPPDESALDVGFYSQVRARQARAHERESRISRQVARLQQLAGKKRSLRSKCVPRKRVRVAAHHQPPWKACG